MTKKNQNKTTSDSFDTFASAYSALKESAEALRGLPPERFDELIPHVDRATAAYAACKERVEAVKKLLSERGSRQA